MTGEATSPRPLAPAWNQLIEAGRDAARTIEERILGAGRPPLTPPLTPPPIAASMPVRPWGTVRTRVAVRAAEDGFTIPAHPADERNLIGPRGRVRFGLWEVTLERSLWVCGPRGWDWSSWRTLARFRSCDEWAEAMAYALTPAAQGARR